MSHDFSDEIQSKFQEALPLMRLMTGSNLNSHVDRCWMDVTLKMQGPDGLFYFPVKGRSWYKIHGGLDMIQTGRLSKDVESSGHVGTVVYNGRALGAISLYYLLSGDDLWKTVGQRVVKGLGEYPGGVFWPGKPRVADDHASIASGWVVQGLTQFFQATGYEPALKLAGYSVERMKKSILALDGGPAEQFLEEPSERKANSSIPFGWQCRPGRRPHFHSTTLMLLGILEYAGAIGDRQLMALVQEGYEYAKLHGQLNVGYFPERVPNLWSSSIPDRISHRCETSEICQVADMIALGLKLSELGMGDYWDDVDRWLRNQFADGQLTDVEWVHRMTGTLAETPHDPLYQCVDDVPRRNIGAFASWPSANDWYTGAPHYRSYYPDYRGDLAIMHCCTGNGARAIYYAWEHVLDFRDGKLRVNLLLNRSSPCADVDSYIPYEGRVDVKIKQLCDLSVRMSDWISPEKTACRVNDQERSVEWRGRYARVGLVKPGDGVVMTFPIPLRTEGINIQGSDYKIVRKGNEVIMIDPPGRHCPMYQRAHYRSDRARWKKSERFVANNTVRW